MPKRAFNIHDIFVKESFSDPRRAVAFFERFLPEPLVRQLDFDSLTVLKESYINETLQEHFSDLVFEVSLEADSAVKTDVVLMFEHKSSPDRNLLFQVGHYLFARWAKDLAEGRTLKPIIPVIYYQGKRSWKVGGISDLFKNYPIEVTKYIPVLRYVFIDLKTISEEQLLDMRNSMMAAAIITQQWRINPAKLREDLERIFRLFPLADSNRNFLEMIVVYALNVSDITEAQLGETIKSVPEPIKAHIMTTYIRLIEKGRLEGKIEGKLEGKLEGIKEGKVEVVHALFDEGFETQRIAKIVNLNEEEVWTILKEHGKVS